ncbi:NAD(P)/FAD-dependent oxidoreductase [Portibacter lacus]|uniref:FAD-dependent dehydrogenase n=1 Tax=Portibacter lacus TaxID=1099794 RepID=A0AA37SMH0_9BACT|nr:FAD-dependent oxidoreductase [Portibacter lacus]GLR16057.1 FAD-dependent dehydrogenase [Portibacter lacus]
MIKQIEIKILPEEIQEEDKLYKIVASKVKVEFSRIQAIVLDRKSIDARGRRPKYVLRYNVFIDEKPPEETSFLGSLGSVKSKKTAIIVGAGPAGYFAALEMIALGIKPIVIERGKDAQARRRDLKAIQQDGIVNPDSNYCFGEGGAGTYSDGKLYTRSLKRGNYFNVLKILVEHGASPEILLDAHPHIGSNKLPRIVAELRETIETFGGEILFETKVVDFIIKDGKMKGVVDHNGKEYEANATVLATGHSARDIYYLLHQKGVKIEPKDYAIGVRIEHPQELIDEIQYGSKVRHENLPASSYKLVCQIKEKGVFSFCMCPGGLIVPASTAPGELVVNGMSLSRRDSPFANSGFVTSVTKDDFFDKTDNVFAGLEFQQQIEKTFFNAGDGSQKAPAQRMTDFVNRRESIDLNPTSYIPGIYSASLHKLLPIHIYDRLAQAIEVFKYKLNGYYTAEANLVGLESRTSSPIRIPRNRETYMHETTEGLFPCGEGAGYAGGILSAAMDGQNVARKIAEYYQ